MNPREFNHADRSDHQRLDPQAEYRINVTLAVKDIAALWSAAAAKAMTAPGMTIDDVLDTIGPREAPCIRDCIAMLVMPMAVAGCAVDDFWIDAMPNLPPLATMIGGARQMRG